MSAARLRIADMSDASRLAQLAADPRNATREEIYLAVVSLYRIQGQWLNERERALMDDILARLARDVRPRVRISLAERLAEDPDLPRSLALHLASGAIGAALRTSFAAHREQQSPALAKSQARESVPPPAYAPDSVSPDSAERLVAKLASAGQLRAGFLLRVLQQGQVEVFDTALSRLLDIPLDRSRTRFYTGGPRAVALACRAVGIDRCVFPTVYRLSRQLRNMPFALDVAERQAVDAVFEGHSKPAAMALLRLS